MSYYYQQNIGGKQVPITVHLDDKDKKENIFLFFYDDAEYIGAVRYHVGGRYYNTINGLFLCSDGLTNMVTDEQIEKVLNSK